MRRRFSGCLPEYERDRLGFLLAARDDHGGVVALDSDTTVVNDVSLACQVLGDTRHQFAVAGNFLNRRISAREDVATAAVRRHLNAGLRARAVAPLGPAAELAVRREIAADRHRGLVDPLACFERAFSEVVATYYFGSDGPEVDGATRKLFEALSDVFGNPFALPPSVPSPVNLRIRHRYRRLRALVDPLLRQRAEPGREAKDYVAHVVRSGLAGGSDLSRLADLVIGSLLAARRVPAAGAAWTVHELAARPALADRLRAALAGATRARPSFGGGDELSAVIMESIRLHPPTWLIRRVATKRLVLGGYAFDAGHNFLVSPYVIHRDPAAFSEPDEFRPQRWSGPGVPEAFLAFGRGVRRCPGQSASMVLLAAGVRALVGTYDVRAAPGVVRPDPSATLVPAGLRLQLTPLGSGAVVAASRGGGLRSEDLDALREALPCRLA